MLEERERSRLAELAQCDPDAVERIIAAAAAEMLVVVLPSFHLAGEFAGWDVFACTGFGKAAHLAETGAFRALCGTPRPFNAVMPAPRARLCVGCESHVRGMVKHPVAVAGYDRGEAPRQQDHSPIPPAFRKQRRSTDMSEDRPARSSAVRTPASVPAAAAGGDRPPGPGTHRSTPIKRSPARAAAAGQPPPDKSPGLSLF